MLNLKLQRKEAKKATKLRLHQKMKKEKKSVKMLIGI